MGARPSRDAGFSLIEVLATVAIVGITFMVFVGGMGTSFLASDYHRKQAVAHTSVRNFAEAVKAAPFSTVCPTPAAVYAKAFTPPPPERPNSAAIAAATRTHTAPSVAPSAARSYLLAFFSFAGDTDPEGPAGMTSQQWLKKSASSTLADRVTIRFGDQQLSTAAPTGPRTVATSSAVESVAQLVSVRGTSAASNTVVSRGVATAATPAAGSDALTLTSHLSTAVGDAVFAQISLRAVRTAITPPPGWTLVSDKTQGSSVRSLIYETTATAAGGVTYVWRFSSLVEAAGGIASYGGTAKSYEATVVDVDFWDGASFVDACPDETSNEVQRVSLRVASSDGRGVQTVDVVKRCQDKRSPSEVCADSP